MSSMSKTVSLLTAAKVGGDAKEAKEVFSVLRNRIEIK